MMPWILRLRSVLMLVTSFTKTTKAFKKNPAGAGLVLINYRSVIGLYFGTRLFITTQAIK
jgi:hypothetical protein